MEDKVSTKRLLDGLRNELANTAADMAGISPRLSLHAALKARCAELELQIEEKTGVAEAPMSMGQLKKANLANAKRTTR